MTLTTHMKKIFLLSLLLLSLSACKNKDTEQVAESPKVESSEAWDTELKVENVKVDDYESSTKLEVSWEESEESVDHYKVTYKDGISSTEKSADSDEAKLTLENLKAGTEYEISVTACLNSECTNQLVSDFESGTTSEEYWQIQGEGSSYKEADHVVADGQSIAQVSRLGGDEMKMYYNPGLMSDSSIRTPEEFAKAWRGMRIAVSDDETYKTFTAVDSGIKTICEEEVQAPSASSNGGTKASGTPPSGGTKPQPLNRVALYSESSCPDGGLIIRASQAIPVKTKTEEFVRLFFEAQESEGSKATNNYFLDSLDGLVGEDFNPSKSSSICGDEGNGLGTSSDAECEATTIIDKSDGLKNSRQAKLALPLLESEFWDMEAGTFLVVTGEDTCGATRDGLFYAQWDGEEWIVEKDSKDCATPLALEGHGPVLLHLGEDNYKLYYEQYREDKDTTQKPLKMFYTNGNNFADFESYDDARDVHFLWPNGEELSSYEESGLGDHFIYLPTLDLDLQYMIMNLGGRDDDSPNEPSTGLGLAILVNP